LVISTVLLAAAPAVRAITGNFVKDIEHPFVGLAVFYDATGAFSHHCSGSLLSPRVFLTAGHCVADVSTARVYFQQDAGAHSIDHGARSSQRLPGRVFHPAV